MQLGSKTRQGKYMLYVMGISFCCALLSLIFFMFHNRAQGGAWILTLQADFDTQQIPFNYAAIRALRTGSTGWQWNSDLGASFVGAYGFYCIGSPFFYLACLFGERAFPYLIGWFYMVKYVVAAATSYLYMTRFVKDCRYAVIGALLYAFSGFQTANLLFYHFHDVTAFFPVLLLEMESMLEDRKPGRFALSVALNCFVNYFFFLGEVLFAVVYFLFRFWNKPKVMLRQGLCCLVEGALGTGLAGVLLLPSVLFVCTNPRTDTKLYGSEMLSFSTEVYLYLFKGMLLPAEAMNNQSAVVHHCWHSSFGYLPLVGLAGAISYCRNHRDWLRGILVASLVISMVPGLTSAFYGFSEVYQRFWYMPILMLSLASVVALEEKRNMGRDIAVNALAVVGLVLFLKLVPWSAGQDSAIYRRAVFLLGVTIALSGLGLLFLVLWRVRKRQVQCLVALVAAFSVGTTSLCAFYYRQGTDPADQIQQYQTAQMLPALDPQYRYVDYNNAYQLMGNISGTGAFNSTVSAGVFTFYTAFDAPRENLSFPLTEIPGIEALLAGRYQVTTDPDGKDVVEQLAVNGVSYYITQQAAAPIGFARSSYLTESEFQEVPVEQRAMVSLQTVVIPDDAAVEQQTAHYTLEKMDPSRIPDYIVSAASEAVSEFQRDGKGFSCVKESTVPEICYFSVPMDDGWTATVDGEMAEILSSNGMMAISLEPGRHEIVFRYHTPGLRQGVYITLMSVVAWVGWVLLQRRRGRNRAGRISGLFPREGL